MYKISARMILVLGLASLITLPTYARGFGGGGFGRGGGFDRGGFDRGVFDRGSYDHGGINRGNYTSGFGGHETHPDFGGGFSSAGGDHPVVTNHPNYGVGSGDHGGQFPNHSQFPTDGGFGSASGNRVPTNSFNGNSINHNVNVNNINANGNHPYNGYHDYHGYYGGYHGYGWNNYNPTAAMWTFAGVSSVTTLASFLGMSMLMGSSNKSKQQQPASYSNVTYNNGDVYIDGQSAGSSAAFYQQAQNLARTAYSAPATAALTSTADASTTGSAGTPAVAAEWQNLGTFSLTQEGTKQSDMMVQLQVNKDGVLSGTYYNQLTMETQKIYGALDKTTQRVSWTIGQNPSTVFDAGLGDLLKEDSSVLVHYGPSNTQRMAMIRLKKAPPGVTEPAAPESQPQT